MASITSRGNGPRARTSRHVTAPACFGWSKGHNAPAVYSVTLTTAESRRFLLSMSADESARFAATVAMYDAAGIVSAMSPSARRRMVEALAIRESI